MYRNAESTRKIDPYHPLLRDGLGYVVDWWHDSQKMTDLPDGSLQVDLTVTGYVDVRRWVLSFGGDAKILEPESLRLESREEVAKMQEAYGE